MGTGETLFQTGVWLIPVILLATVVGLYLLVRYWQNKTRQSLKQLRAEIRRLQAERRQLDVATQPFSLEEREPYGSRIADLQTQFGKIDNQILDMERQNIAIHEGMRRLAANRWQATIGAPYFWYSLRSDLAEIWKLRDAIQVELQTAEGSLKDLSKVAWQVATQARQVQNTQGQVDRLLDGLRSKNVRGDALHQAVNQAERCRTAMAQIPHYFLEGEEAVVLEQADLESVSQAHAILIDTQPLLDRLRAQLEDWEDQHAETKSKVSSMSQVLENLDRSLDAIPSGLNLAPQINRLNQLKVISDTLHATLSRIEIENMQSVGTEAERVHAAVQEVNEQFTQARQKLARLEAVLPELNKGLKALSAQFAALGTNASHPIAWGQSRVVLTKLSQEATTIGTLKKPRTPEQLDLDLDSATRLNEQRKELAQHCQNIDQGHAELLSILAKPEFSQGEEWLQKAHLLIERVNEYDLNNWPSIDGVSKFSDDLQYLEEGLELLVTGNPAESIPELELPQRLEDTRELDRFYQDLRSRAHNIQTRLDEMQRLEKQARDQLSAARAALNQLSMLARSNKLLTEIASQDVNRLSNSQQQLSSDFDQRQRGSIERKARAAGDLMLKIEQSAATWLDRFNKEVETQGNTLASNLSELDAIATLDEPAVAEARRLLNSGQSFGSTGADGKPRNLDEIILELKRRSDYWQTCSGALRALEDVSKPVVETHAAASQSRQETKEQFAEISAWLRGTRSWPPTAVSLQAERQELDHLEEQWDLLKQQPNKAITLVAQMSNLSAKYQTLLGNIRQVAERAAREQDQIETLEAELDEMVQLWQQQWRVYRDNPIAEEEIHNLLGEIDNQRSQIKRQARQGSTTYDQILQAMQSLHRRVRVAQISIDDNHVIDLNGRIITYR
jgi:phage terminase small subunit